MEPAYTLGTINEAEQQGRKAREAGQHKVKDCPYDEMTQPRLATAFFVGFDRRDRELRIAGEAKPAPSVDLRHPADNRSAVRLGQRTDPNHPGVRRS